MGQARSNKGELPLLPPAFQNSLVSFRARVELRTRFSPTAKASNGLLLGPNHWKPLCADPHVTI